jgi:hypothetical protein
MATRREFVKSLPAVGTAFAVGGHLVLGDSPARAQGAVAPLAGHFHPKGKAPSKFTLDVLKQARGGLPFGDTRDFEELKKGLIAPMKDLKIMANAGHVAWDMERFQFLDKQEDFDSIHPSLLRQSRLNNNYGLYEVIPGIYQVRGGLLALEYPASIDADLAIQVGDHKDLLHNGIPRSFQSVYLLTSTRRQCVPGRERVHVVSPMCNFSIFNLDD